MADQTTWLIFCKMTCIGGSEKGECPCERPIDCPMQTHPDYALQRKLATTRMFDHHFGEQTNSKHPLIRNLIDKPKRKKVPPS